MRFTKMHGAGNDYVYVSTFDQKLPEPPETLAPKIAHRNTGVGGDGLILIEPSKAADAAMRMFNADGSEAEMCGNGIRCVGKYLYDYKLVTGTEITVDTKAGVKTLTLDVSGGKCHRVRVDMGTPILDPRKIPSKLAANRMEPAPAVVEGDLSIDSKHFAVTLVSMGNPHCVIFVDKLTDELVRTYGPLIEKHPEFPARTNVEFVEVVSPQRVRQRTWERGSGETLACGTGACAVCVAGFLTQRTERTIINSLLGGDLELTWDENTGHVHMTGPATEVFSGEWDPPTAPKSSSEPKVAAT